MTRRLLAAVAVVAMAAGLGVALTGGVPGAAGDWRTARHDPARTGLASGHSNITAPAPYWRLFLGGRVGGNQLLTVDEGGGGATYVVAAGRVTKLSADGEVLWRSDNRAITSAVALARFDGGSGSSSAQLAVASAQQVIILDPTDGAVVWEEPVGEMGTIGAVRVGDMTGDGAAEVWIQECYCCQLNSGKTGFVYSFAAGFDHAEQLAELPHAYCGGGMSLTLADYVGAGALQGNLAAYDAWSIFAPGESPAVLATTEALAAWIGIAQCEPIEAAVPMSGAGADLVCTHSTQLAEPGRGHRVRRLTLMPAQGETAAHMAVAWQFDAGEIDGGLTRAPAATLDLDGDGALEVVVSGTLGSGQAVTYVLDAATGALLGSFADATVVALVPMRIAGAAPSNPGQVPPALIAAQRGTSAVFLRFVRGDATPVTAWLTVPNRRMAMATNWPEASRVATPSRPIAFDVTGDHLPELWLTDANDSTLFIYQIAGVPAAAPTVVSSRSFGAARLTAIAAHHVTSDGTPPPPLNAVPERLIVATSDGYLQSLVTANLGTRWRVEAGNYYDAGGWNHMPLASVMGRLGWPGQTGDAHDAIVVPDSRGVLVGADASEALMVRPPRRLWELEDSQSPSVITGPGGVPGVMCRRLDRSTTPATEQVASVSAQGATLWTADVGAGITVWGDAVPANLNGDGIDDALVQWGERSDLKVHMTAFDGATGDVLWIYEVLGGENRNPAGFAAADYDGDGLDDAIIHHYGTRVISGATGQEIAVGGPLDMAYFMPMWTVFGAGAGAGAAARPGVVLQGGLHELRTLDANLSPRWTSTQNDLPYPYAAVASCPSGSGSGSGTGERETVIAAGSLADRGKVSLYRDAGGELEGDPENAAPAAELVWLAQGHAFATAQAMQAANAVPGQLTSVHMHADLTGTGAPSAVLGSSDGWLYAVDPCTGALQFAHEFGPAVGAIAFGDTDGDGLDEIVVSVADGYLYGLKHAAIAAPTDVADLDPAIAPHGTDIDFLETTTSLGAAWSAVPGAIRYQVAIADAEGAFIQDWLNVAGTNVVLTGLPFVDGATYRVAVRAVASSGAVSPDAVSDGITVSVMGGDPSPPAPPGSDATAGQGCCGASPGDAVATWPWHAALVALALAMRRVSPRRRRGKSMLKHR